MKCESIQLDLPLYLDSVLSGEERSRVDDHIGECPVCRQKLAHFQEMGHDLRALARPAVPDALMNSVRMAVASEVQTAQRRQGSAVHEWMRVWLMPSGAGAFASVLMAFVLVWTLHTASNSIAQKPEMARHANANTILLADSNGVLEELELSPAEYEQTRSLIAGDSARVNPNGALVALTRSLVRGEMKDDEVVVVADVFGNGLAQISEVVEPSHNTRAVAELEQALKSNPDYAPFVPANRDGRSESIRVVLKIQSVDVQTNLTPKRKRSL
jgi:hypothetical protein